MRDDMQEKDVNDTEWDCRDMAEKHYSKCRLVESVFKYTASHQDEAFEFTGYTVNEQKMEYLQHLISRFPPLPFKYKINLTINDSGEWREVSFGDDSVEEVNGRILMTLGLGRITIYVA